MDFFDTFPFTKLQVKNRGLDWVMQKIAEFQKAIDNIPEAVKSLTAKDFGAAPDGYGLGVYGVSLLDTVDANECKQIGWYKLSSATLNGIGAPALMRTDGYSVKHVVQTAFSGDASDHSFIIKKRICKGDVWGEWEWENPPMSPGVEYCTTERFWDEPVYCKVVNFGTLPNTSTKEVSENTPNKYRLLRYNISTTGSNEYIDKYISSFLFTSSGIKIKTNSDMSAFRGYVHLYYTKST